MRRQRKKIRFISQMLGLVYWCRPGCCCGACCIVLKYTAPDRCSLSAVTAPHFAALRHMFCPDAASLSVGPDLASRCCYLQRVQQGSVSRSLANHVHFCSHCLNKLGGLRLHTHTSTHLQPARTSSLLFHHTLSDLTASSLSFTHSDTWILLGARNLIQLPSTGRAGRVQRRP